MANTELIVGSPAPEFPELKELRGKIVILYFYPKDDTPGCTKEACGFRDIFAELTQLGAVVVGVSKDSADSHRQFREKYILPFDLLSDPDGKMIAAYDCWKKKTIFGKTALGIERSTFVIDGVGIIRRIWRKVDLERHLEEVSYFVKLLRGQEAKGLLRVASGNPTAGCGS